MRRKLRVKSEKLKVKDSEFKVQSSKFKICLFLSFFTLLTFNFTLLTCQAKVYIDITSPAAKKLPIAVQDFSGSYGKEVSEIIRHDLEFTGLFTLIDRNAYIESPAQPFNQKNWTPLGVETVVKGAIREAAELQITVMLYDVYESKELLRKEYKARKELVRPLSHTIANDIYAVLTGEKGIFRSRIAFVGSDKGEKEICFMDWDGNRIMKTGLNGNILLSPRWSKDGAHLIYSAERNRQWGIYLLDFTSMKER
jgi:TolB protein